MVILSIANKSLSNLWKYSDIKIENLILTASLLISENIVSEGELALALGYLIGDTCLYRAACEEPRIAREYLGAAEMLLQTMKLIPQYVYKTCKKK